MTSLANYPSLAGLRLTEDDLFALAKQGSVYEEQHRGKVRFKLRFRTPGACQVVRYVPTHKVRLVEIDIARLQSNRRAARELRKATRRIRQARHEAKRQLQPVLHELGFHFHGTSIRRQRHKSISSVSPSFHQVEE